MLRAARFEAKLGFQLDPATAKPIGLLRDRLAGVPPARLFDETLKLFLTGHGARSFEVLRRRGLLAGVPPTAAPTLHGPPANPVWELLLRGLRKPAVPALAAEPVSPPFPVL